MMKTLLKYTAEKMAESSGSLTHMFWNMVEELSINIVFHGLK